MEIARKLARLRKNHCVSLRQIQLGDRTLPWYCIDDPDQAIHQSILAERQSKRDGIDPFWATNWRSGFALANYLIRNPAILSDREGEVLELGCGSGVVSIACALLGQQVCATDISGSALLLTDINARLNEVKLHTRRLDWSKISWHDKRFDLILAADIVYDRDNFSALENCLSHFLSNDGTFLIAEPHRMTGDEFFAGLRQRSWSVELSDIGHGIRLGRISR